MAVRLATAFGACRTPELRKIGEIIGGLPVLEDYNKNLLPKAAESCADLLDDEGLDKTLQLIEATLPAKLRETTYVLACDVAAADQQVTEEGARMLEMIRHRLKIDRLIAAAIERRPARDLPRRNPGATPGLPR